MRIEIELTQAKAWLLLPRLIGQIRLNDLTRPPCWEMAAIPPEEKYSTGRGEKALRGKNGEMELSTREERFTARRRQD